MRSLELAGNPISHFDSLQAIAYLPTLQNLSLSSPEFGSSPIVSTSGYKHFILNTAQLSQLDGEILTEETF